MRLCVLVAAFCLLTSPGLAAFPDTTHNVGVGDILAPRGSVDSGVPLAPRIIVNNYGTATETLWTFMRIGAYLDSAEVTGLPGRGSDSVSFRSWTPAGHDSMEAVSWTACAWDSFPEDDTARVRFLVRVRDVAVTNIIGPRDTLDSGVVVWPRAEVWNYGNQTETFPLEFRIGSWVCSTTVVYLIPGGRQEVAALRPYTTLPGAYVHRVEAIVPGDLHPENNVMLDTFWVRRGIRGCVLVTWITDYDSVALGSAVPVRCSVANLGNVTMQFWTFVKVWDTVETTFSESTQTMLGAGGKLLLRFGSARLSRCGMHVARCSLYATSPCSTNFLDDTFYVVPLVPYLVGLESLFGPPDTVGPDDSVCFGAFLHNRTYDLIIAAYSWTAYDPWGAAIFYVDTVLWVPQRSCILTTWRMPYVGGDTGRFMVRESLGTPQLDVKTRVVVWRFYVRGQGVGEGSPPEGSRLAPPATLVRGVLSLPEADGQGRVADGVLLAVTGRTVMALKPGPNDVRHLPAGVYFVHSSLDSRHSSLPTKVVIQR
jgi:hypothetical protein